MNLYYKDEEIEQLVKEEKNISLSDYQALFKLPKEKSSIKNRILVLKGTRNHFLRLLSGAVR